MTLMISFSLMVGGVLLLLILGQWKSMRRETRKVSHVPTVPLYDKIGPSHYQWDCIYDQFKKFGQTLQVRTAPVNCRCVHEKMEPFVVLSLVRGPQLVPGRKTCCISMESVYKS